MCRKYLILIFWFPDKTNILWSSGGGSVSAEMVLHKNFWGGQEITTFSFGLHIFCHLLSYCQNHYRPVIAHIGTSCWHCSILLTTLVGTTYFRNYSKINKISYISHVSNMEAFKRKKRKYIGAQNYFFEVVFVFANIS